MSRMEFAFISVDGAATPRTRDQGLVRSHCMRGVNRKWDSRRSRQARRRALQAPSSELVSSSSKHQTPPPSPANKEGASLHDRAIAAIDACERRLGLALSISDLAFLPLACSEGNSSRQLLAKYGLFKSKMYPVETCVDFPIIDECASAWFAYDEAFVHATLFMSAAMEDFVLRRQMSHATRLHLQQTLRLLTEIVAGGSTAVTDATVYVVLSLCIVANVYGEGSALTTHLAGLRQVIDTRAQHGTASSRHSKFEFKIDLLDLGAYMCNGPQEIFTDIPLSWSSISPLPASSAMYDASPGCLAITQQVQDQRLLNIFWDLRWLSEKMNQAPLTTERLNGTTFRAVTHSVQCRLIHLEDGLDNPLSQGLCLGMMCFLLANFRILAKRLQYPYLRHRFQGVYAHFEPCSPGEREIWLWILMMAGISLFEPREPWLRGQWVKHAPSNIEWDSLEEIMSGIMWIDSVHGERGRETLAILQSGV